MEEKHVTQTDVCVALGINRGAMSSYLSGRYMPKNETVARMAKYLEVSPGWLWGVIDTKESITNFAVSLHERLLVEAYRNKPEMQKAIDILLGINA